MKTRASLLTSICFILILGNTCGWNLLLRIAGIANAVLLIINAVCELKKVCTGDE